MSREPPPPASDASYDPAAARALLDDLFPRDQVDTLHALTGVPVRSITRWLAGSARVPPTLLAKFEAQAERQAAFAADLRDLLDRHADAGALRAVLRQAVIRELNSDFFQFSEEI